MLKSMLRAGLLAAASSCAVLFASCGITPLYHPPVSDKTPAEMFDADVSASLLKTGSLRSEDGDVTIAFSECSDDVILAGFSSLKGGLEKCVVRGCVTIIDAGDKEKVKKEETWLPVLLVPFRNDGKLYFYLVVDQMYLLEKYKLNPEYIFMTRPYSYILTAERKDGGWEVGFVQFATIGLDVKKISDRVQVDESGTVFNPSREILDMLTDPKNYEVASKTLFLPVKSGQ